MALTLTRALVLRHGAGRRAAYDAALLDIAQDFLLDELARNGLFDDGRLVFKGGTSLRKHRLGNLGRFSTDLDFAAPNPDVVLDACEIIDGARIGGFTFALSEPSNDARHWTLTVNHPELGAPRIGASVEFARRALYLPPEHRPVIALPIHAAYPFQPAALPVIAETEACAEKLARYRRTALGRDVYDLAQFAGTVRDEQLLRRIWVLKVWTDVVDDHRGTKPLDPADILTPKREQDFQPDSIGVLTQPVDIETWERTVRQRFSFLADLTPDEQRWATCNPRDRHDIETAITATSTT